MKSLLIVLLILLGLLQYKLWFASGGITEVLQLKSSIAQLNKENTELQQKNAALTAEVTDLKQGNEAIEERARSELGMVKKDEVFYQIVH